MDWRLLRDRAGEGKSDWLCSSSSPLSGRIDVELSRTSWNCGNQDRSGNKTEHSLSPEQEPDSEVEMSKKAGSFYPSSADIEGSAPEAETKSVAWRNRRNGVSTRGSSKQLAGGTIASHMPRLTATTSDTIKRTVFNAMTRQTAHREDVRLALIPQTIITGDANWRRQVLGQSDLRTVENIGNERVGLRSQRMDDAITTKEDFDWFIRDLARNITHVSQSRTGIGSNAEIGDLQTDTTRKRSMTMSWFPVRYMLQCRYLYKVSYSHMELQVNAIILWTGKQFSLLQSVIG